jgi:hypothetical protein
MTPDEARSQLSELAAAVGSQLLELTLDQSAMRLELVELPAVEVSEDIALACAKTQRLDWMNARASVVDAWRQIEVDANPLMSGLDLTLSGSLPAFDAQGRKFDGKDGTLRAGLRFDTPLDRIRERSAWRETLVGYQRSRRDYMLFEDRVLQSLRNTLRLISLSQLNFELRRVAVQVALSQVDLARLRLQEPPRPTGGAGASSAAGNQFGATTARDLVSALNDLLDSQNDFLSTWVGYHVLRMVLDYELGTMRLTPQGGWKEPAEFSDGSLMVHVAKPAATPPTPTPPSTPVSGTKAQVGATKRQG